MNRATTPMRYLTVILTGLLLVAAGAQAAPADAKTRGKAAHARATRTGPSKGLRLHELPRVWGAARTDAVEAWVLNATAQWPVPCARIEVLPHAPFYGGDAASAVPGGWCIIYITPLFYAPERTNRDHCQLMAHEVRHLRGEDHQATDPADVMFAHPDGTASGTLAEGEGWLHEGAVPGCW